MLTTLLLLLTACDNDTEEAPVPAEPEAAHAQPHGGAPAAVADSEAAPTATLDADGWSHYGRAFALTDVRPASEVLGDPAQLVDQTVLLEGKVTDVCQRAGCWMVITDDERTMRVLMQDHSFAVDKGGTGARCRVEGQIVAKEIDPAEVAHFESESEDVENMPEKAADGDVTYQLVATGVAMKLPAEG